MHQPDKLPLSVVIITYNAERTLRQTITSVVSWAGEVVVVDSGSTDATPTIARRFGCQFYEHPFAGYGPQKQFAIAQATYDWVLLLDADESLNKLLQDSIQQAVRALSVDNVAFSLPRSLVFLGRTLQYSGENQRPVLRIFNRRYGRVNDAQVHEAVEVAGPVVTLSGELRHDSYASLTDYLDKLNQYTSRGAENMAQAGRRSRVWTLPFRFAFTFITIYFIKGGFLDGFPGFAWAFLSAAYPVIKYTKLYELNLRQQRSKQLDKVK